MTAKDEGAEDAPSKRKGRRKGKGKGRGKGRGKGPLITLDKVRSRRSRGKGKRKAKRSTKAYKVPSDEVVVEAILAAMAKDHIVRTQTELQALVKEELKARDPEYTITGERLRKVALEKAGLTIEVQGREVEGGGKAISRCPVCRSPLKAMKNVTIYGGTVTLGFKCTKCPYWTGKKRRIPTRYTFFKRKSR